MTKEPAVEDTPRKRWYSPARLTRDGFLFVLGVGIVIYEVFISDEVRAGVLAVALTLVGAVPALRHGDREADRRSDGGEAA